MMGTASSAVEWWCFHVSTTGSPMSKSCVLLKFIDCSTFEHCSLFKLSTTFQWGCYCWFQIPDIFQVFFKYLTTSVRGTSIVRCGLSCLVGLNTDLYRLCGPHHGLDTFWARWLSCINKETTTTTSTGKEKHDNFSQYICIPKYWFDSNSWCQIILHRLNSKH